MAINAGIQLRNHEVGAVRLGFEDLGSNGKPIPHKLDKFRFTSPSLTELRQVARLYGGEVTEWYPRRGQTWGRQWQVFSEADEIPIALPPGALVITQDMTLYDGGGLRRKCDGVTMSRPQVGPCQCPQPENPADPVSVDAAIMERKALAAQRHPAACKPYTRICMCLPDIGDIGAWVLRTRSEEAAAELIAKAMMLERARAAGVFLSARIAAEQRQMMTAGMLRQYPVPVIRLDDSIRAIANGTAGRSLADQLPPPPGQLALTAGPSHVPIGAGPRGPDITLTAQALADRILTAERRPEVDALAEIVKRAGLAGDLVWAPPAGDSGTGPGGPRIEMRLSEAVNNRWRQVPAGQPDPART